MSQNKKASRSPRHATQSTTSSIHLTQGRTNEERLEIAKQLESKLSNHVKNKTTETNEVTDLRTELCSHFCEVILSDPSYSMESDCIHRLWRTCFYAQINNLRGRLIKLKSNIKRKPEKSAYYGDMVVKTETSLKSFISDAIQLYSYLATRYEAKLNEIHCDGIAQNLHKLLIHLGDLHRYANVVSKAEVAYAKASMIAPGRGNPYNQLAVVSQLGLSKSCISLYWYCRSLSATFEPFETSRSNMMRLFDFNQQWLQSNSSPVPPNEMEIPKEKLVEQQRQYKSLLSRYILAEFVHFHGKVMKFDDSNETLMLSSYSIMKKFKKVLQEQTLGEALVMKMVTINVYSCSVPQQKPISKAFALLFSTEIAEHIVSVLQKGNDQMDEEEKEKGPLTSIKLLSPLLLFLEWLKSVKSESHDVDESVFNTFEKQASNSFWKSIVKLANNLNSYRKTETDGDDISEEYVLKEHDELRGFKPFSSFISHEPSSSFFKVKQSNDNFYGYLSTMGIVQALDRFKSRLNGSSRSIVDTQIRVERFLACIRASLWTPSEMKVGGDENMIVFDSANNKFIFRDDVSIDSSDDNASDIKPSTELSSEKKVDDVQMNDIHGTDIDDDDEDDFIVYNGMDISDSGVKFDYADDIPQNPSKINSNSKEDPLPEISSKASPSVSLSKDINTDQNVCGMDINLSLKSCINSDKKEADDNEEIQDKKESTPLSGEQIVDHKDTTISVNPPPGFDLIPQPNQIITHNLPLRLNTTVGGFQSKTTVRNASFGVRKQEEPASDLHMLPSNILEPIGINTPNTPYLQKHTQPPPGFTNPQMITNDNLSRNNMVYPSSFDIDRIGGSSLLFGSPQALNVTNGLNSHKDEIVIDQQHEVRTMNPFVTPFHDIGLSRGGFHSNLVTLSQNGSLQKNQDNQNDDNFADLRNDKLGFPGIPQTAPANSWNPFV